MKYIYAKDSEGFVVKKLEGDLLPDEITISKKEYDEISGENHYKQTFGRGGKREGAGRPKSKTAKKAHYSIRFEEETDLKIREYAKNHKMRPSQVIRKVVENGLNIA